MALSERWHIRIGPFKWHTILLLFISRHNWALVRHAQLIRARRCGAPLTGPRYLLRHLHSLLVIRVPRAGVGNWPLGGYRLSIYRFGLFRFKDLYGRHRVKPAQCRLGQPHSVWLNINTDDTEQPGRVMICKVRPAQRLWLSWY